MDPTATERAWIEAPRGCLQHDSGLGDALAELGNTVVIVLFAGEQPLLQCMSWYDLRASLEQPTLPPAERVRFWASEPIPSNYVHRIEDAWYDPMIDPLTRYYNTLAVVGSYMATIGTMPGVSNLRNAQETIRQVRPLHRADVIAYVRGELSAAEFRARAEATTGVSLAAGGLQPSPHTTAAPHAFHPQPGDTVTPTITLSDDALFIGQVAEQPPLAYGYGEQWQVKRPSIRASFDGTPALPGPTSDEYTLTLMVHGRTPFRLTLAADGTVKRCVLVRNGVEYPMPRGVDYPRTVYTVYQISEGVDLIVLVRTGADGATVAYFYQQEMTPALDAFARYLTRLLQIPRDIFVGVSFRPDGDLVRRRMELRGDRYYFTTLNGQPYAADDLALPVLGFTYYSDKYRVLNIPTWSSDGRTITLQRHYYLERKDTCIYEPAAIVRSFDEAIERQLTELPMFGSIPTMIARINDRTYLLGPTGSYDVRTGNVALPVRQNANHLYVTKDGVEYRYRAHGNYLYDAQGNIVIPPTAPEGRRFFTALRASIAFSYQSPGMRNGVNAPSTRGRFVDVYHLGGEVISVLDEWPVPTPDLLMRHYTIREEGEEYAITLPAPLPATSAALRRYIERTYPVLGKDEVYMTMLIRQYIAAQSVLAHALIHYTLPDDDLQINVTGAGLAFHRNGALYPTPDLARPTFLIADARGEDVVTAMVDFRYRLRLSGMYTGPEHLTLLRAGLEELLRRQTSTQSCHRPPPSGSDGIRDYIYYDGQFHSLGTF